MSKVRPMRVVSFGLCLCLSAGIACDKPSSTTLTDDPTTLPLVTKTTPDAANKSVGSGATSQNNSPKDRPSTPSGTPVEELYPTGSFISPMTERVQKHIRALGSQHIRLHDDRFIKVGGSGSSTPLLLQCFEAGRIDLGDWSELKTSLKRFRRLMPDGKSPFGRKSLAAKPGATAHWVLSGSPSHLQSEIDAVQPRFALVHYGTNDMHKKGTYLGSARAFMSRMSQVLKVLQEQGIVPIITAITPRNDHPTASAWIPFFNRALRALAQKQHVPFLDIHSAILSLPNRGRAEDQLHGNVYRENGVARPCFFGDEALGFSYNVRNLLTIRLLDQLFKLVKGSSVPTEAADILTGSGSQESPWVVPSLPFAHRIDTSRSSQVRRRDYPGCQGHGDVSGPEFEYELKIERTQRVRAVVLGDDSVEVDLFLLEKSPQGDACLRWGDRSITRTLVAGSTYRFIIDTRTVEGSPRWGAATLNLHPCGKNDPVCKP
jgi:hypothetical protein